MHMALSDQAMLKSALLPMQISTEVRGMQGTILRLSGFVLHAAAIPPTTSIVLNAGSP